MRGSIAILVAAALGLIGCGSEGPVEDTQATGDLAATPVVYTVNYPLTFFAERIGGDLVRVVFPAPADVDPAYWSPDADAIAAYQGADLILLNGADFAKWVQRATLPQARLVDTGAAFSDRLIELGNVTTHSHGPDGEHEHGGWAFTTWLDPELATLQAEAVARSLVSLMPEREAELNQRLAALVADLERLDQRLADAAVQLAGVPLIFSHPVYQYLARRYDLNAADVHWEPDEMPDDQAWDHFEELLRSHPAKWMLWEGTPLPETASRLEELGVAIAVFDPCGNRPERGDYLTVMAENAAVLESISP
ncbi:MAG: metal ABC transporter substrate-binding protein [Acidobacteria bacterium]|nr:metal ABC transporter substrate-binding protein [Acidobacteriota bacterium]